jgi:hypothetical protein
MTTVSSHVYSAVLLGTPNRPLSLKGGTITLDTATAPHVQGQLRVANPGSFVLVPAGGGKAAEPVWTPDLVTFNAMDPRTGARVRITADGEFPSFSQHREFNLALRSRDYTDTDGELSVTVASDEALLADWAPVADDLGAFSRQTSLRSICNYVIGKAIPGAALAASPTHDRDMTVYTDAVNMLKDTRTTAVAGGGFAAHNCTIDFNDTSWSTSFDGDSFLLHTPTQADSAMTMDGDVGGMRHGMQAGRTYTFSATGNVKVVLSGQTGGAEPDGNGGTKARARALVVHVLRAGGVGGYMLFHSDPVPNVVNTPTRVSVTFTLPDDAEQAFLRFYHGGTVGSIRWDSFRLSEYDPRPGADNTNWFDGSTTDTAAYLYSWAGTSHLSNSIRAALIDRAPELLLWKAGQSALDFLAPLVQYAGLRLVCDENRVWTLRSASHQAPGVLSIRTTVNMLRSSDLIDRDDGEWFNAAVAVYTWTDAQTGLQRTATDSYSLPGYTRVRRFEFETPYPGPGFAQYAVERAQGRGRRVTASTVSDYSAQPEQPVVVYLPNAAPIQVGAVSRLTYDLDTREMEVQTRTTDTPVGAIDLLAGSIDSLASTIDAL